MPQPVNTVSSFVIRQITGRQRTVRLVGRALPYKGLELETEQRVQVDWYPGSPEATVNVFGSSMSPTTVSGTWKDRYLGENVEVNGALGGAGLSNPFTVDGEPIFLALDAADLMDRVAAEGQEVEVTWGPITRVGILSKFKQKILNAHDIEWTMEFTWTRRDQSEIIPSFTSENSITDAATMMRSRMTEVESAIDTTFPANSQRVDDVRSITNELGGMVLDLEGNVAAMIGRAFSPFEAGRRSVATMTSMLGTCTSALDTITQTTMRAFAYSQDAEQMSMGEIVAAGVYVNNLSKKIREFKREATIRRQAMTQALKANLKAVHIARDNQDLRDVSRIYYGTTAQWRRLLAFNVLSSSELVAGQIVLVPNLEDALRAGGA